jgi:radical SAM superfamily enzyme YgiQ (UPF0313 family)
MIDIVICVIPIARECPQTGPAYIKSYLELKGYNCKVKDLSIDLYNSISEKDWDYINENEYSSNTADYINEKYPDIFKRWCDEIKLLGPKLIGLSAFSRKSTFSYIEVLSKLFKKEMPNTKIILGGHATEKNLSRHERLLENGYIDYIVIGEGELATEKIIKGCSEKIISCDDIKDLTQMPTPNYDDIDLKNYKKDYFVLVGSRGCVNHCKFCKRFSSGYRSVGAENLFEQVAMSYLNTGCVDYYLADACSNGNVKEFVNFAKKLIDGRNLGLIPKIKWRTQLACMSKEKMNDDAWDILKRSGLYAISFGLETGSESLRYEMGKNVKNDDIEFLYEQCIKHDIYLANSMICGYYSETEDQFLETLDFIKKWAYENKAIKELIFGGLLNLDPGTYLYMNKENVGIKLDKYGEWYYKENTFPFRYKRWMRFKKFLEDHGIRYKQILESMLAQKMEHYK